MVAPSFKKVTGGDAGTTAKYGAADIRYIQDILDATHATDRLQASVIEGLHKPLNAFVRIEGSNFVARDRNGVVLHSSSTNATTALQTAFNQGGRIHIGPGIYNITASLEVPSNSHIQADHQTIVRGPPDAGSTVSIPVIKNANWATAPAIGDSYIILEGGTWDGNSANNIVKSNVANIHFDTVSFVWVKKVRSLNSVSEGIKVRSCTKAWITDSYVFNSKLESDGTGKAGIMGSLINRECIFARNIVEDSGGEAIGGHTNCDRFIIANNICRYLGVTPSDPTARRCYILLEGSSSPSTDFIRSAIIANNVVQSKYQCIHIQSCDGVIIANNNLTNVGKGVVVGQASGEGHGIRLGGVNKNIHITSNMIRDVEQHGISFRNEGSRIVIENNEIINVSREEEGLFDGIHFDISGQCNNIKIADNMIGDTRGTPQNGFAMDFIFNGNTISNLWIHDNQAFSNTSGGVHFDWSTSSNRISGDSRFFKNGGGTPGTSHIASPFNNTTNEVGLRLSGATVVAAPTTGTLYTVAGTNISMTITGSGTVTVEDSGGELLLDGVSIPLHGLFLARGWKISFTGSPSVVVFPHG
jgi:Right handed beta helix region